MFKKYFQFQKMDGITEVYLLKKNKDILKNDRFVLPVNNFTSINPITIDLVTNQFILYGFELRRIATFDYVLRVKTKDSKFSHVVPIPQEIIIKDKLQEENDKEIEVLLYQFYEIYEK